ncbi:MAG: hypothetical protein QTN59_15035 [Candidatus Electrothrix communis]|nr:MAG: hypothetical protein QTN59_15035 [Candidatus Electrothrix communis]
MTAIEHLKRRLRDFSPSLPDAPNLSWENNGERCTIDAKQFPVPNLLLYLLCEVCEFPLGDRSDKTHWIVPFTYKGVNYSVSHEKFGLRFYVEKDSDSKPDEVLGKIQKAVESAEKYILSDVAKKQIAKGNVTICNRFNSLNNRYNYFRQCANSAYSPKNDSKENEDFLGLNNKFSASRDGGYNALAMIDAYFSRLEHFLVLAFPFVDYNRDSDDLSKFIGSLWSDKFRRIFELQDKEVQKHYDVLVGIKEKYRNTFAHGGFEKNGQSFYFHLDKFGAIPASMSGLRDSVHFSFFPIDKDGFESVCSLFDSFDTYLSNTALPKVWKFAESGLDLTLDEANLTELLSATEDAEVYDVWIKNQCDLSDIYVNADY